MTFRRMIIVSLVFHGLLFLTLILSSFAWPRKYTMPIIHQVELVRLPVERAQQPERVLEQKPKPEAKKPEPKVKKQEPFQIKRTTKITKPIQKKKPEMKEPVVTESPKVLTKEPKREPVKKEEPVEEAIARILDLPEIMPILKEPSSEYAYYHDLIGREIRKRWLPPPVSYQGQQMETIVSFSLSRSGRIKSGVRLEKSSGNVFYDQAALRATMGPLPPPPPGYPEELLDMRLVYVLGQNRPN